MRGGWWRGGRLSTSFFIFVSVLVTGVLHLGCLETLVSVVVLVCGEEHSGGNILPYHPFYVGTVLTLTVLLAPEGLQTDPFIPEFPRSEDYSE